MRKENCTICGSRDLRPEYSSPSFSVWRCRDCGHREAAHSAEAPRTDYYEHTPSEENFVQSLLETRRRQAREILDKLVPVLREGEDAWLDFGCGRGSFLEEARAHGYANVGGFEASRLSTEWLEGKGIPMAKPSAADPYWPDWESLPFVPGVVSLLDVAEHFEGEGVRVLLRRMLAEVPDLKWIVIKVPVSEGILFRAARAMKALAPGPYRQLFQVGTYPPHFHYFSNESLIRLLKELGLKIELSWPDPDLDNLFHRIPALGFLPGGRWAARFFRLFHGDTRIVCARVPAASNRI